MNENEVGQIWLEISQTDLNQTKFNSNRTEPAQLD